MIPLFLRFQVVDHPSDITHKHFFLCSLRYSKLYNILTGSISSRIKHPSRFMEQSICSQVGVIEYGATHFHWFLEKINLPKSLMKLNHIPGPLERFLKNKQTISTTSFFDEAITKPAPNNFTTHHGSRWKVWALCGATIINVALDFLAKRVNSCKRHDIWERFCQSLHLVTANSDNFQVVLHKLIQILVTPRSDLVHESRDQFSLLRRLPNLIFHCHDGDDATALCCKQKDCEGNNVWPW